MAVVFNIELSFILTLNSSVLVRTILFYKTIKTK